MDKSTKITICIAFIIITVLAITNLTKADIYDSQLLAWWTFNSNNIDSNYIYDSSSSGLKGYVYGGATTSAQTVGKLGQALKFTGTTNYAAFANSGSFSEATNTISLWIKATSLPATTGILSINGVGAPLSATPNTVIQSNTNCVRIYRTSGYGSDCTSVSLNIWHHLVFVNTKPTASQSTDFYLDGQYKWTDTISYQTGRTTATVYVGSGYNGYFNGSIDDVRIYNRALTAGEVAQLYNTGQSKFTSAF